ncbi:GGDEF domain-containing protein [Paracoccus sp. M683]|uniref:GGDEF domain-containing protein n=1 Tax=Paracoccus sp. M683 TaxID=2594268 RepID=UPI001180406D|nr:GGDEF domain-containing protein [Paracoccus sp. M683]TRW97757.1 GGDEF domain-containing protein [Paracoccus sp. M683]
MAQIDSVSVTPAMLNALLPMHLIVAPDGGIDSAGPTLRKILRTGAVRMSDAFVLTRPVAQEDEHQTLLQAAQSAERVFLRMIEPPHLTLRGHAVALGSGRLLLNLGFGIGLADAVRELELKDSDFAPAELAIELLFLHEANRAVMGELSRFNLRLEEAREVAETQAFSDPLTGLYNRRGLELALAMALRAANSGNPPVGGAAGAGAAGFALAHLDLDRFKEVNDQHGHAAGDQVLCRVARVLSSETRNNDTVARVGGDEFVLILPGMTSAPALERLSERIIAEIERPIIVDNAECGISASIGITMSSLYETPQAEQMLADADAALYRSKNGGRARASLHQSDAGSGSARDT